MHVRNGSVSNSEGLHAIYDAPNYKDGIGWAHVTLDARTSAGNNGSVSCYMNMFLAKEALTKFVKPGGKYTWLIEVSDLSFVAADSSSKLHVIPSVNNATMDVFSTCDKAFTASGSASGVVTAKSSFSSLTQDTRGYCYIPTGCYADFYLRISLYEGEYTGQYKPYVGPKLYASQAELKVATDGISLEVSKVSSAKYVNSLTASWTLPNIKTYAAENHSENWNVESTANLRIGDTVYIKGTDSTRACPIYIKTTVKTINSATNFTGTSHGYEDVLPVETIKSTINQSSDTVKIQAKHIEIDGTATFKNSDNTTTTLGDYLINNYDSKGAAATVQNNLNNLQIGGRNLLRGTGTGKDWTYTTFDAGTRTFTRSTTVTSES